MQPPRPTTPIQSPSIPTPQPSHPSPRSIHPTPSMHPTRPTPHPHTHTIAVNLIIMSGKFSNKFTGHQVSTHAAPTSLSCGPTFTRPHSSVHLPTASSSDTHPIPPLSLGLCPEKAANFNNLQHDRGYIEPVGRPTSARPHRRKQKRE